MKESAIVVWVSRHDMTADQMAALAERLEVKTIIIEKHNIMLSPYGVDAAKELAALICVENELPNKTLAAVVPAHVAAAWSAYTLKHKEPTWPTMYLPVSVPAPAVEGEVRGGGFTFHHWEKCGY